MIGDDNDVNNGCASESFKFIRVSIINCTHRILPLSPLLSLPAVVGLADCRRRILSLALVHRRMLLSRHPHHPMPIALDITPASIATMP